MSIRVYRWFIPVKHFPSHTVAMLGNSCLSKMSHKGPADSFAPKLGSDKQILDEDSGSSLPGRVVVEEKGHSSRFSIPFCHDYSKLRVGSEPVAMQVFLGAGDRIRRALVIGQLSNEREYLRNILGGCFAKLQHSKCPSEHHNDVRLIDYQDDLSIEGSVLNSAIRSFHRQARE